MARLALTSALCLLPALLLGACDAEEPDDEFTAGVAGAHGEGPDRPSPRPESTPLCDITEWEGTDCITEDGNEGTEYCVMVDGEEVITACLDERPGCEPGWNEDYGCMGNICYWDGESFVSYSWAEPDCNTPLVLNFEDAPVQYSPASAASFDLSRDGSCVSSDWPTAPWLALDRDGDGFIRDGGELFGSATTMSNGEYAPHGFAALAELDSNRDGKITAADDRFGELVLWNDLDEDRLGAYGELRPLSETTLVSIDLSFGRRAQCDHQGNCGVERASFEYRDAKGGVAVGEVVDVHLACR